MILLLADLIEQAVCEGVPSIKKVADAVWESATIERHKLLISTLTQALTTPPSVTFGGATSIPQITKAVTKARKLSNLQSLLAVIAKVIRLIGRLAAITADIQRMVADVTAAIDRVDALLSGETGGSYYLPPFRSEIDALLDERQANVETASSPFPEPEGVVT